MADKIQLEVVTPTGSVVSEEVNIVTALGFGGEFGVLPSHAPFLSTIKIGTLTYKTDDQTVELMISGGFCEVSSNKITFLVESAEFGHEIDVDRAIFAKERAEKRLVEALQKQEKVSRLRAEIALQRAMARLKVAQKISGS